MPNSIKYLHIMTHHNSTHNGSIINMINDEELPFNPSEHTFVMAKKQSFENFKHYDNVFLNENIVSHNMKEFKNYAGKSKYVFLHYNELSYFQLLRLDKEILNKMIWCVWGESHLYPPTLKGRNLYGKLRGFAGNSLRFLAAQRIKKFYAIGIGFKYDAIAVRKRFGDIRILAAPYGFLKGKKKSIDDILSTKTERDPNAPYKIMVGHSAYARLNHIKILDKLYKFKDENILISLVLSYGNQEYAKMVEDYALRLFPGKVEIIKNYMTSDEYFRYLNSIDICILDFTGQSALGNFWRMLYLEKKIFLNDQGILKLSARLEGAETYNVDDIDRMSFEEFIKPPQNTINNKRYAEFHMDEMNCLNMWLNTLRELR